MNKKIFLFILLLTALNLFIASWPIINGNIAFHTDIARDFSLLEEIVKNKKPTLIGPRAGGISGIFHGPLWLYLNLPAFLIGKGNPVVVGWFWIIFSIFSLTTTYYTATKIFNKKTGFLAILLYSAYLISYTSGLFNSFGALIFFPLFFLFFSQYLKTLNPINLSLSLFFFGNCNSVSSWIWRINFSFNFNLSFNFYF